MAAFTMTRAVSAPYDDVVDRVRDELAAVGFGVLTEIDLAATMRNKVGEEIPPTLILGACRPQLAHRAFTADARVAALLPCNVVISAQGGDVASTVIEVMDPTVMPGLTETAELAPVAAEAAELLGRMLDAVSGAGV